jgi:hypothetical protein
MVDLMNLDSGFRLSYPNVAVRLQARHKRVAQTTKTITIWENCMARSIVIFMN